MAPTAADPDVEANNNEVETAGLLPAASEDPLNVEGGDISDSVGEKRKKKGFCGGCKDRCKDRLFWLTNLRRNGLHLPVVLGLLGNLVMPTMDAASDWAVLATLHEDGDTGWFWAPLTIMAVSGGLATLGLWGILAARGAGP